MSTIDDFKRIVKDVRGGKFKPVYFLHGEEGYFIDRIAEEIELHAIQEHEKDFNQTIVYGRDTEPEQVKDACLRYPMMAERQLVVLREAQTWRIDAFDKLEAYFKTPTPTTVLVILYKHKKADGRKTWLKELAKKQEVFHSEKLKEDKLPDWIQTYTKFHKRRIGPNEAKLLADHLGSDLSQLTNEVGKLCIVTEENGMITGDLIQRHVGISKDFNIFELQKALSLGDHFKAQRIARYLGADKDHKLFLSVASLNGFFAKVALIHANAGKSPGDIAAALKVPPFFLGEYQQAARYYDPARLRTIQHLLRDADLKSKGFGNNSASDGELLHELVARVML